MNYTDLIKIEHPPEAEAGELVTIQVYIKNQYSAAIYISPSATVNGTIPVAFTPEYSRHPAGVTYYYTGTFTMPNENAKITAWSWYWGVDGAWHYEDYQTRTTLLTGGVGPVLRVLEVDITPSGTGTVETDPASEEGRTIWHHNSVGNFIDGTTVQVTAIPGPGYEFEKWSDEIVGGVSYDNPAMVQPMTERRAVKAHFRTTLLGDQTLEVDITPTGTGHVLTLPASQEGRVEWHHNDVGTFPLGTDVQVTAVPDTGYVFDHWSDEIMGGTSENNPEYVQPMTEHRGVKAHFREGVVDGEGITKLAIFHGSSTLGVAKLIEKTPPVTGAVLDDRFKIQVVGANPSASALQMGVYLKVTKPDGSLLEATVEEAWPYTGGGGSHTFTEPAGITEAYNLDQLGDWNLLVELLGGDEVIDTWEGLIFSGVAEPPAGGTFEMIGMMIFMMIIMMMMNMMNDFMEEPVKYVRAGLEVAGPALGRGAKALGKGARVFKK